MNTKNINETFQYFGGNYHNILCLTSAQLFVGQLHLSLSAITVANTRKITLPLRYFVLNFKNIKLPDFPENRPWATIWELGYFLQE